MIDYISQLENNSCIPDYVEPWVALLLLAAKPHQESCVNIQKIV